MTDPDPRVSYAIRDAASEAAKELSASPREIMGALCLMAAWFAYQHCEGDTAKQDQWFADLIEVAKLQLLAEGRRN